MSPAFKQILAYLYIYMMSHEYSRTSFSYIYIYSHSYSHIVTYSNPRKKKKCHSLGAKAMDRAELAEAQW